MTAQTWPFEPYKIKMVEPLAVTTRTQRERALRDAGWNLFGLRAEDVTIDLLTDSGTAAMSHHQWAALLSGDETYAGARSWSRFEAAVREIFGFRHVIPTHQGRAAERILFPALLEGTKGDVVPSNAHFDTTKGNLELLGVRAADFPTYEARDPSTAAPFKGDADLAEVEKQLRSGGVPFVMLTVTNNTGGGQPVSMANIKGMAALAREHSVPFVIDACRFAENAFFIQQREPGYADMPVPAIVREMFAEADAITMSAKKDGLANIGGFICVNADEVAARARQMCIAGEGYPTYGGLAGRDLDAIAVGLREVLDEDYLRHRIGTTAAFVDSLVSLGIPVLQPPGGHAAYLDARRFLPHLPWDEYPAQTLVDEIYLEGGVRGSELGTVTFGVDATTGVESPATWELVRLALPRRVYTRSHLEYVIETVAAVHDRRDSIRGLRVTSQPRVMRNFTTRFEPAETEPAETEPAGTGEGAGGPSGGSRSA
jgi:tryptophanase